MPGAPSVMRSGRLASRAVLRRQTENDRREREACRDDPSRFNETILGREPYWSKQEEICESVVKYPITCVKTGNGIGKTYVDAGIALWFGSLRYRSKAVVAAPTNAQLSNVLWAEVKEAYVLAERNGHPLGGRLRGLTLEFGENWRIEGFGQGSIESKAGRHAKDLLALVDEASGVHPSVHEAIDSLNPSRRLYTGNPLRPEGKFYELCELSADNPNVNVIQISSLESPHIDEVRSEWGMADRTFVDNARYEYGEDSIWWLVHILGQFPGELSEALLPIAWLNAAGIAVHVAAGPNRMGVDIAKGLEGDLSMIVIRDDNGILGAWWSNRWSLEELAKQVKLRGEEYGVLPQHITFDSTGIGTDFDNRLRSFGILGAKGYQGSLGGGPKHSNLRSLVGWLLRRRIDPNRVRREPGKPYVSQAAFAIPMHLLNTFRRELQGCRTRLDDLGRIALEPKEDFQKRLKFSPNFLDAVMMTFAFPNA
jgi:phage terminase large subunit